MCEEETIRVVGLGVMFKGGVGVVSEKPPDGEPEGVERLRPKTEGRVRARVKSQMLLRSLTLTCSGDGVNNCQ